MEMFTEYSVCQCGAITIYTEDGKSYSCLKRNLKRFVPGIDLRKMRKLQTAVCCDHCVNHYGLDLCACGSGEPFETCENELEECGRPMQVIGEYSRVVCSSSWFNR